jgi:hypothetical protein
MPAPVKKTPSELQTQENEVYKALRTWYMIPGIQRELRHKENEAVQTVLETLESRKRNRKLFRRFCLGVRFRLQPQLVLAQRLRARDNPCDIRVLARVESVCTAAAGLRFQALFRLHFLLFLPGAFLMSLLLRRA